MDISMVPPQFPDRALSSKAVLYGPLQDIDIYVEDEGSEVFYTELLKRLVGNEVRIAAVIPLRSRTNVIAVATNYTSTRPALFIIDGDLNWITGLSLPSIRRIFIHPCYCVENYLFCERAMIQIVVENSGMLSEDEVKNSLNWQDLRNILETHLVPIFIEFAVAFTLCPEIKTVSRGIGSILRDSHKSCVPLIDFDRVASVQNAVRTEVLKKVNEKDYNKIREKVTERVKVLSDPLDIVSGKDFLIPIQMFEANRIGGQKSKRKSFMFRLARHCTLDKLQSLRHNILDIIQQNNVVQAVS